MKNEKKAMQKAIIKIEGMRCPMCETHVNDLFRKALNPKKVKSSHRKGETILIGDGPYDEATFIQALDGSGYKVEGVVIEPYQKRGLFW